MQTPVLLPLSATATYSAIGRSHSIPMQSHLLDEASKIIPDQQKLINVVSKRVRQLSQGHRPLVETTPRMMSSDIALTEVIQGKLTYRDGAEPAPLE